MDDRSYPPYLGDRRAAAFTTNMAARDPVSIFTGEEAEGLKDCLTDQLLDKNIISQCSGSFVMGRRFPIDLLKPLGSAVCTMLFDLFHNCSCEPHVLLCASRDKR